MTKMIPRTVVGPLPKAFQPGYPREAVTASLEVNFNVIHPLD